jgi:adenylate kinase
MIIFMGVVGAGKSVQGKLLADTAGLPWLSTGEFFRMLISGQKRKDMMSGKLLDNHDTISLVQKVFAIVGTDQEFVLDGFPRTLPQADWLLSQVKHGQLSITAVVNIDTPEEVVRGRLLQRGRQDDTDNAISERFSEYRRNTVPIIDEFRKAGVRVVDINGDDTVESIHKSIMDSLQIPTNS